MYRALTMHPHIQFSIDNINFSIPSFTLVAFIGGAVTLFYMYGRSIKFHVEFRDLLTALVAALVFGAIGSRFLFLLTRLPHLINNFSTQNVIHFFTRGGIVFYGGLFGVLFAIKMLAKYRKLSANELFQMSTPAIPLFHSIARIGCLLGGCCSGRQLVEPFVLLGAIHFDRLPIPLFESIFNFILFAALLIVEKKSSKIELLRSYLWSYALFRFIIEFFRGDLARGIFFGFSTSQWISIIILMFLGMRCFLDYKKKVEALKL
ncbi:MAG: prolipoprotein diacylglyceryl transferase [Defluviitaleaceae bacterium]|nr:prolipoprotein diacylglyceryl transferase [Defluviitaleaceae bacterium]